jgi:hypothetical protein
MVAGKSNSKSARAQLGDVLLHLRQVQSAVVVSVAALKRQNCELDADIATVLQRSVADRLHEQIERLEALMSNLAEVGPKEGRKGARQDRQK